MAVLKDLIVHGASRFLGGINTDSVHANLIDANDGVFKTITTTTLGAETITAEMLKATNARVSQTLTVDGTISTNKWEAANIANIGGNFYISPTGKSDSGTITITKTSTTTINGVAIGVYTLVVGSASFGVSSTSSTIWGPTSGNQSRVIFTGSISYNNSKKFPLGTCNGTMTTLSTGTNTLTGFTITGVTSAALDVFFNEVGITSVSSIACNGYELQISVYQTYSDSKLRPVGILLTSYGKEKKHYIDIYGGDKVLGDTASGFADPEVRIGQLDGLPALYTGESPSGWGIYTTNGFFKGKIVATLGKIGDGTAAWTIGNDGNNRAYIYSGITNITSSGSTTGTYVGTNGISNYQSATQYVNLTSGKITAQGADIAGKITASSGQIGGWYIGTDTNKSLYVGNSTPGAATNNLVLSPTSATNSNAIGGSGTGVTWFISAGKVFGVTTAGALYSTSGKIGGWDITASSIQTGAFNTASKMYFGTSGLSLGTTFRVTSAGVLTATSGTIGGYSLTANYLQSTDGTTGISVADNSTTANWAFWAGGTTTAAAKFRVTHDGILYATGAVIQGALTASSLATGTKTGSTTGKGVYIDSTGAIYAGDGSTNNFTVSNTGSITAKSGTIGNWTLTSGWLYYKSSTSTTDYSDAILSADKLELREIKNSTLYTYVTMSKNGQMSLDNEGGASYVRVNSVYACSLHSSTAGNRGIYDDAGSVWMIQKDSNNNVTINANGNQISLVNTTGKNVHFYYNTSNTTNYLRPSATGMRLADSTYPWDYIFSAHALQTSDLKKKSIIKDFNWRVDEFIRGLKPIAYNRIKDNGEISRRIDLGFGAQDVSELSKKLNIGDLALYNANIIDFDEQGNPIEKNYHGEKIDDSKLSWSLDYSEFIAPMVLEIQRLMDRVDTLESEIKKLKS